MLDILTSKGMCSGSRGLFNFLEITACKFLQDRDIVQSFLQLRSSCSCRMSKLIVAVIRRQYYNDYCCN